LKKHYKNKISEIKIQNFWKKIKANSTPGTIPVEKSFWNFFSPRDKVLEIGCAWGRIIFECYKRKLKVTGIDINKNEIIALQKKLREEQIPKRLVKAKTENILSSKLKDKSFEGAILLGLLSALAKKDRDKCLKETWRILKPNGFIHIGEFEMWPENLNFKKRYDEDFKITKEYGTISIKNDFGKELYQSHNFYLQELIDLVTKNGFKVTKTKKKTFISYHGHKKPGLTLIAQKII